jgi:Holliday junction DNA helicase RuvA
MIGYLKGVVVDFSERVLLLDVGGVGYEVSCSDRTVRALPGVGGVCALHIHTHVREDALQLFGFVSREEKRMFLTLTKISGVGAKLAIGVLSVLSPEEIAAATAAEDKKPFARVAGVGPKLAARLLTELKSVPWPALAGGMASREAVSPGETPSFPRADAALSDAVRALEGLGYDRLPAFRAVSRALEERPGLAVEGLIGAAADRAGGVSLIPPPENTRPGTTPHTSRPSASVRHASPLPRRARSPSRRCGRRP